MRIHVKPHQQMLKRNVPSRKRKHQGEEEVVEEKHKLLERLRGFLCCSTPGASSLWIGFLGESGKRREETKDTVNLELPACLLVDYL